MGASLNMIRPGKGFKIIDIITVLMVVKIFLLGSRAIPSIPLLDEILVVLFLLLTVFLIIKKRYSIKNLVLISAFSLLMLYTAIKSDYSDPLITFLFILAVKDLNIDDRIKLIYKTYIALIPIHIIFTIYNVAFQGMSLGYYDRDMFRFSLGFTHPNTLGGLSFILSSMFLWINFSKLKCKHFIGILLFLTLFFELSGSRTAYALGLINIFIVFILKKDKRIWNNIISFIAKIIFPTLGFFSFLLIQLFNEKNLIAIILDQLLTNRIRLGAYAYDRVGYTLLGQKIDFFGVLDRYSAEYGLNTFTFDNVYTFMICCMGLLYLVLLSVLFYKLSKLNNVRVNAYLILWALYGITEVACLNGFKYFPIFFIAMLLNRNVVKKPIPAESKVIARTN